MYRPGAAVSALVISALLIAAGSEAATLTIEWDPPTDGVTAGYIVWGGTASGAYSHSIDVGLVTSYEVVGLAEGTPYYFAVQSYNAAGERSPLSQEASGMASTAGAACTAPPATPSLGARASGTLVELSWSPGAGDNPTSYRLDVGSTQGRRDIASVQFGAHMRTVIATAPAGTYWFRLTAANACGASAQAAEATLTIAAPTVPLPGAPTALAQQVTARTVTLTWAPPIEVGDIARYRIDVHDRSGNLLLTFDTSDRATSFTRENVPPGEYLVRVRAVNAAGVGVASNAVTVRVQP